MPYEAAKTLYENVYKGMPVICYNLEGTERSTAGSASGRAEPPASASPTAVPETVPRPSHNAPRDTSLLVQTAPCNPQKQCPRRRRKRSRQSRLRKYTDRAVRKALQNLETGAAGPGVTESTGKTSLNEADSGADMPQNHLAQ